ncbi:MAG: hypothetical protein Kow0031_28960 [Anaerolineae bacterium]
MSRDTFRQWVVAELNKRGVSYRQFAKQAGVSHTLVSRTLSGDMPASADFCIKVATALDIAPVYVLTLAGILPDEPVAASPGPVTLEIVRLVENLSPEQRQEALRYLRYLAQETTK